MTNAHIAQKAPYPVTVEAGKEYWWCSCGLSKRQPFCDGSHKKEGIFNPVAWKAEESGEKWFCGCKQSAHQPFCDGKHKAL